MDEDPFLVSLSHFSCSSQGTCTYRDLNNSLCNSGSLMKDLLLLFWWLHDLHLHFKVVSFWFFFSFIVSHIEPELSPTWHVEPWRLRLELVKRSLGYLHLFPVILTLKCCSILVNKSIRSFGQQITFFYVLYIQPLTCFLEYSDIMACFFIVAIHNRR